MTDRPIILITPSADLYGSDRAFLSALPVMLERAPVIIFSAQEGPTLERAVAMGAKAEVVADFAIRRRYMRPDRLPILLHNIASASRAIRHRLGGLQPSLIYVNTLAVGITSAMRRSFDAPVVVHVHERYSGSARLASRLVRPARSADLIIANSYATAVFIQSVTEGRVRVEVAHNGIPMPDRQPTFGPGAEPLRIGCVGRIHPKKGHTVLFDALAQVGRPWELHLFGDALPEHRYIEDELRARIARHELAGPVYFHGFVTDTDEVYEKIDVSVVPSVRPEEFSLVAAEGQARGCATVVTGPGGVAEVVIDEITGLVVPPSDADALAAALISLDDDRAMLERFARAGVDRVREKFTEEVYRRRIAVILAEVLGSPT